MISIPSAHKNAIKAQPTVLDKQLIFYLPDNETFTVTNADIWQGSLMFDDAVGSSGSFEIGSTHINQMTVSLFDISHDMNFNGASVEVWLASPGFTPFLKGTYTVVSSVHSDSITNITAYDYMDKFSERYTQSTLTYPCTLKQIVADACTFCGVTDNTGNFDHYSQTIDARPNSDTLTFREVIGYVAQIAGYNARMSPSGQLEFVRYNLDGFETEGAYHSITEVYSDNIEQDVIEITGIHVNENGVATTTDEDGARTTHSIIIEYVAGTDDYAVTISGNPLIRNGLGQDVANWLLTAFGGKPFRIGNVTHSSDPTIEASDIMKVTDRNGTYNMLVSETRFSSGSSQVTSSDATGIKANQTVQYTDMDKIKIVATDAQTVAITANDSANDAQKTAEAALDSDAIYGTTYYQYTVDGVTHDVWYDASTEQYKYDDGSGTDAVVAESSLDIDAETGEKATARKGGILDNLELINGSVLIDNDEPSVSIQTVKKTAGGDITGESMLKLLSDRISFEKNGNEVMYLDSNEDDGVIDINSARVHNSLRIGDLEIFEHDGGIGIRRWD